VTAVLARLLVRLSARLVPPGFRARWREEWLAELAATSNPSFRRALGAPRDALFARWTMRERGKWPWSGWRVDLRDAWRALARTPLQSLAIVICLTLGTSLTVLMFAVVNTLLGGRLPGIEDQRRLASVSLEVPVTVGAPGRTRTEVRRRGMTLAEWRRAPATIPGFEQFGAEDQWTFPTLVGDEAVSAEGRFVSGGYFATLGTQPVVGRLLAPNDDRPAAVPVAVISHAFWQRQFGGASSAIGSTIAVADHPFQIVGVLPAGMIGLDLGDLDETTSQRAAVWLPLSHAWIRDQTRGIQTTQSALRVVARLTPGVSLEEAEVLTQGFGSGVAEPGTPVRVRLATFQLVSIPDVLDLATFLAFTMGAPIIVLGIACANVAGVQLARAVGRTHELAIRASLGASRMRVARLLVIEVGLLAIVASAIAFWSATHVLRLAGTLLPFPVMADGRVLLFAALVSLVVTLLAGFVPGWRATGFDVQSGLRLGPRVGQSASPALRRVVIVVQIALSVFLLMTAVHLARLVRALPLSLGEPHDDVVTAFVDFYDTDTPADVEWPRRRAILEAVQAMPSVSAAALLSSGELARGSAEFRCSLDRAAETRAVAVTPDYFRVLRLSPRLGRTFGTDGQGVVVNEAFVRAFATDRSALGIPVTIEHRSGALGIRSIIGVVEDSYERAPRGLARPQCYIAMDATAVGGFTIVAQSSSPALLVPAIRRMLYDSTPRPHVQEVATIADILHARWRPFYIIASGLTMAGGAALFLSAMGLFAVMSYAVSQRAREFGVRLALGATAGGLVATLARESLAIVATGTMIGLGLAVPMMRLITGNLLTTLSGTDPVPVSLVCAVLLLTGLFATFVPGWRLARIDPVATLRAD
jgi:predicted permease